MKGNLSNFVGSRKNGGMEEMRDGKDRNYTQTALRLRPNMAMGTSYLPSACDFCFNKFMPIMYHDAATK